MEKNIPIIIIQKIEINEIDKLKIMEHREIWYYRESPKIYMISVQKPLIFNIILGRKTSDI